MKRLVPPLAARLITGFLILILAVVIALQLMWRSTIQIENATSNPLTDIEITFDSGSGTEVFMIHKIGAGQKWRHSAFAPELDLKDFHFTLGGLKHSDPEGGLSTRGETFVLTVEDGGKVSAAYQ